MKQWDIKIEVVRSKGEWLARLYRGKMVWNTGDGYTRKADALKAVKIVTKGRKQVFPKNQKPQNRFSDLLTFYYK